MKFNWDIIDPRTTIRLWTVSGSEWNFGQFKSFWLKKNALKKVEEFKKIFLYVELVNELTGKSARLKDNPDRVCPPGVLLERRDNERQSV